MFIYYLLSMVICDGFSVLIIIRSPRSGEWWWIFSTGECSHLMFDFKRHVGKKVNGLKSIYNSIQV